MAGKTVGKTMKAAVLRKLGQKLKIERLPIPEPGPGEILVKVGRASCRERVYACV